VSDELNHIQASFLASCSSRMSFTVSGTMTLPVRRKKASASVSASDV
jgi:hypothetical protein